MFMKRSLSFNLFLVALVLTGVTAPGFAQAPPTSSHTAPPATAHLHGRLIHQHPFMHVLRQLNLTAEQKAQIRSGRGYAVR
jgi:Spy/CpxP family protein refolding chaperone